ncbi:MAG: hypothetical protein COX77_04205 [Candidatus Komeilibacteria bacterium CG_4_10_14_0_2_um_filter_37_10]|uniref:ATP-cone domain-containing protein n=1 Tax=Candidatus Komeilibacteria bacterium CG_4_10_14_0_2_um_filter_37_10 TaxID=1974470 RepID=A0A2M7VDR1_9BACT|nr:MAG: hypothetical protein COX77_04205 [Candidatus Komeilibacteria bacterium CG_4_10_14_0_2_um_filter_37_10]
MIKVISIKKFDGNRRRFSFKKLVKSVERCGVNGSEAEKVAHEVLSFLPTEVTSNQLYELIYKHLQQRDRSVAQIYSLRQALSEVRPECWEKYMGIILQYYGYQTKWNVLVKGASVEHQVDVIARKDDQVWLVECKHHFNYHHDCGLGEILQVQARLEDVMDGCKKNINKYNFTGAWLVTNTKFSEHAKRYAAAKNIRLTGWRYPEQYSLERLIQDQSIYPITMLRLDKATKNILQNNNIITIQDAEKLPIPLIKLLGTRINTIQKQIQSLAEYEQ